MASRSSRCPKLSVCVHVSLSHQAVQPPPDHLPPVNQHGRTLVTRHASGSAPAPPGNNFTCMLVGSCGYLVSTLRLYLARWNAPVTLHASRCARFRHLRTICILTALYFFRVAANLVAFSAAEGCESRWHFAVRPVAETLDKHLWLRRLQLRQPLQPRHKTKLLFSAREVASPPCQTFSFYTANPRRFPRSKRHPGRCGECRLHCIVVNVVFLWDLRSVPRRPSYYCRIVPVMGCKLSTWVLCTKPYVYLIFKCYYLNFHGTIL